MQLSPWAIVALSATSYGLILRSIVSPEPSPLKLRATIRGLSATHSIVTTILALYVLRHANWSSPKELRHERPARISKPESQNAIEKPSSATYLDDTYNPLIADHSSLANTITSFETGYLIYDTSALLYSSYLQNSRRSIPRTPLYLAKDSPVFLAHHLALISALAYLQTYIAARREKGIWVIIAFLLMNASNPLLHARWFVRRKTGRADNRLDAAFAVVFALCRVGMIRWVLRRYGEYHGLSAWGAYKRLRVPCKTGVAALVGFNGLWWVLLVAKITERGFGKRQKI
ncbi:hypothetical protein AOQ84DRAFT_111477 [Glonium stellatum]|uniref:TLC domain-containing protein n=1 Tax=Glonium stellatum TaxID=574774 RepID=A0A8E2FAI8_9PEZI|nr:hypothetical protein AOQ84DRAFT_111477 [Glonium stellatum]